MARTPKKACWITELQSWVKTPPAKGQRSPDQATLSQTFPLTERSWPKAPTRAKGDRHTGGNGETAWVD
ncbi:MAG: hypothetical protein F6K39_27630 [Okeania sp. SIO3B3]|nr:hypothetical protein [Okeania sp. SIO3B3]